MLTKEKLQKAIETTIAAGYQLNSEAFEFLMQNAESNDPVSIMNLALERMENMHDKPMFIERQFLEKVLQQTAVSEIIERVVVPEQTPHSNQFVSSEATLIKQSTASCGSNFQPYAKDIPSRLKILEDATTNLLVTAH